MSQREVTRDRVTSEADLVSAVQESGPFDGLKSQRWRRAAVSHRFRDTEREIMNDNYFPSASLLESVRFTTQIAVPNVVQGLFRRRRRASELADSLGIDHRAVRFYEELVNRHEVPIYVRVGTTTMLLVHRPEDIAEVLQGSPDPFASDPDTKSKGMAHFQPDALTITRAPLWQNRRRFAEAILDAGSPPHRMAETFIHAVNEEADKLASSSITWEQINTTFQRLTRRVIFGDAAADDSEVTDLLTILMDEANNSPSTASPHLPELLDRVQHYIGRAEPGCLASLVGTAPKNEDTHPAGQLLHWMFAMGDTLPANVFRALALLASHHDHLDLVRDELAARSTSQEVTPEYLTACLHDTMRLWPTTVMFGRVTTRDTTLHGVHVPADTQILIYNLGNHRNRDRVAFADQFSPQEWISGNAAANWSFNFFSHGPQGCPGSGLALHLGTAVLARLIGRGFPRLYGATLSADRPLPPSLNVFDLEITINSRKV